MKKKRVLCLLLAGAMVVGMTACGSSDSGTSTGTDASASAEAEASTEDDAATEEVAEPDGYYDTSTEIYNATLGNFYEKYQEAEAASTVSEKYALYAQAEAYMLESAVFVPTYSGGGKYEIGRLAPKTVSTVTWGLDYYRYQNVLVTTDLISAADKDEMKTKYAELKGTGTYREWAESYLTEKGYTLSDTFSKSYITDPESWDILANYSASTTEPIKNTVDGLMEYDVENELQPALAEKYDVSEDGCQYTFYLREGVSWVDSQGREVGTVTADDFVAGLQHMMDAAGGMEYLVDGLIKNASGYLDGTITDFSEVGVEAVDDTTLVYTLEEPCSYFTTLLGHSIFMPMCRDYYESQGGKFGVEYDSSASDYNYGKDKDSIAYCGPYIVTNATEKNSITFSQNESYWNKDSMTVTTMNWIYEDGSDATKAYNDMLAGTLSYCTLNTSAEELAQSDGNLDGYAAVTENDGSVYQLFLNLNRNAFANTNDGTTGASEQTEEDAERTNAAMNNVHFRRALLFSMDRSSWNAQQVGDNVKDYSLRNLFVPGDYVALSEDVTIDINGTATTFAAGTYYGAIVQAQLDADGFPVKVWDPEGNNGLGSSDGFDGWYNVENATAELETAISELEADGVTIDEENPIYVDFPYDSSSATNANMVNVLKQSIEEALGGKVIVNTVSLPDSEAWAYAGAWGWYGYECNYDLYDYTGWVPDYDDPSGYLQVMLPDYYGYNTKYLGIY